MLEREQMPQAIVDMVKRHLNITWYDTDTDEKIMDAMVDAEAALNHKLGATIDYFQAGPERKLYLNYLLYDWNNALEQFDAAYRAEILQIRHKYEVQAYREAEEDET